MEIVTVIKEEKEILSSSEESNDFNTDSIFSAGRVATYVL